MTDVKRVAPVDGHAVGAGSAVADARPGAQPAPSTGRTAPPRVDSKDPRYLALRNFAISMSIFNILGYTVLGFEQPWTWPLFALAVGYSTELIVELVAARANRRPVGFLGNGAWGVYTFLLPTHITALAANMLLYANDVFWPIAFAVVVAVGQKAVLQAPINGRMRHFMNPSNLGITAALLVFPWVNVAPPYQFTEHVSDVIRIAIPLIILTAGTVLNGMLTKRIPLIVGWLGGFVIQALIRHWFMDVQLWAALGVMTGVAFVLFTNYMVTDPGTTPSSGKWQFMFGSGVAAVYGVLIAFNVVYTLFFAVTLVCLIRGTFWWVRWLRERRAAAPSPAGETLRPATT
ncbi:enediyne biosynthesis protein [Micromonospora sp. WMMD1082]|uniref:enediyne biosynthesis protein n=1 Tax=Micromonospora sp. WMMD1082 TaxID=3016104 RepID=UPI002417B190|nr:enediyne biosynthesis protein [Micromonospora sp. WMMD1082]MDG4793431.1 enediyne biosynthesis protein [Micromonospora sp. WMMD1082]